MVAKKDKQSAEKQNPREAPAPKKGKNVAVPTPPAPQPPREKAKHRKRKAPALEEQVQVQAPVPESSAPALKSDKERQIATLTRISESDRVQLSNSGRALFLTIPRQEQPKTVQQIKALKDLVILSRAKDGLAALTASGNSYVAALYNSTAARDQALSILQNERITSRSRNIPIMVAPFRVIAGPKSKSSWFIPVGPLNSIEDIAADVFLFRELHSLKAHFAIRQVLQQKVYSGIIAIMWESQVPFVSKQVQICGQTRLITAESPRNCRLCGQSHSCRDCEDATGGKSLGPVQWTSREPGEYVATKVAGGVAQMKLLAGEGAKRKEKKRKRESHIPKVPNVNKVVEDLMNV